MKKVFNILRNILAFFGVLFVAIFILAATGVFDVSIDLSYEHNLNGFLRSLKKSGPYVQDTLTFHIQSVPDSAKAAKIREYFQLDTLYEASASTWEKTLAIAQFVARNIPHANQQSQPKSRNAIDLWEFTRTVEPGFNCRLHSILTFELLTSVGIDATYITCLPKKDDGDCHVVNQVWIPELEKWVMIDSDSGGYCATDGNGNLLSLQEIRERYISGDTIVYHPRFSAAQESTGSDHYRYMAKNTYWFSSWDDIHYGQEAGNGQGARYFNLVPSGYKPFLYNEGDFLTSDADQFWAAPRKSN
jgi:hypothetical protein